MTIKEVLHKIKTIQIPKNPLPVEKTCAAELIKFVKNGVQTTSKENSFKVAVAKNADFNIEEIENKAPKDKHWAYLRINEKASGEIIVSHTALLYSYTVRLLEDWKNRPVTDFVNGKYYTAAFKWHRPLFDYLLTQMWRTARNFDPEDHIKELARSGHTHLEVNGLAMPVPFEDAVPGEFYSQFYTYCIALDQYVYSELNKGLYPIEYLNANLSLLKKYAEIGRKYGLEPGILCFEPRTVPEQFFKKYPTLRGGRVDHPYRSRMPRYTMTLAHPLVQDHYKEMIQKILKEVPDLAYMSIWTNDSGSGFEYTSSLYVGRNGGPYLIREWRTHDQIAEVAAKNIVNFMKILRDGAAEINPDFHVSLRLEPFKVEHDHIMKNLEKNMDVEVPSLLVRGYDLPYFHNKYPEISGIAGSIQHTNLEPVEKEMIQKNKEKGIGSQFVYSQGNGYNVEPLIGFSFPWLVHEKLAAMKDSGVEHPANLGGFMPSSLAPYHINQEVFRNFMLEPDSNVDDFIQTKATDWVGEEFADQLVEIWKKSEDAIRWQPPLMLYSGFGFVWLRVWVRPIIPDLLAVPAEDRRYYEDYTVSAANNTNHSDLGRDVLFQLITKEYGEEFVKRIDKNVLGRLEEAIKQAAKLADDDSIPKEERTVFVDQRDRLRAMKCWVRTQRSVAAWVAGVYNYLDTKDDQEKKKWRAYLDDMMDKDIQNTKDLLNLWKNSDVNFMIISETGETSYMYADNFGEKLQKKIELVEKYRHVEPRIDESVMWRV